MKQTSKDFTWIEHNNFKINLARNFIQKLQLQQKQKMVNKN